MTQSAAARKPPGKKQTKAQYIQSGLTQRLTPERIAFQPRHILQNDFYRRVIMIKNFPSSIARQCLLSKLSQFKNTTFSLRATPLNDIAASSLINNQINNKKSRFFTSKKATEKIDAETEEQTIVDFYRQVQAGHNKIYLTNIFIEFYGATEKELNTLEIRIKNELQANKITYESLRFEQKEGFEAVYPLLGDGFVKSANNLPSNTLACLYSFSFSNRNDENGILLGETVDGGYIFLDLDLRDSNITTGNYTILGQSGQGKTWLQKKILSQEIFKGKSVLCLDPDRDYVEMIGKLGGTNINCADGRVKINPLEVRRLRVMEDVERELEGTESVDAFRHASIFYQHLSWLREFFGVLFPDIPQTHLNALMILIKDMYVRFGITENTDFDELTSDDYPTFEHLYAYVNAVYMNPTEYTQHYNMIPWELLQELLLILYEPYRGSLSHLLNGKTNIRNDRIINFDLHDLLSGSFDRRQAVLFNIITYIWNRIALRTESILFCVDELSLLLNRRNPIIVNYLRDFAKRIRKYGSKMGTATQELDDYNDPEIRHLTKPIFANTSFKFLFHPEAFDLRNMQEMLKLSDGEIACISQPKAHHCLLKAGADRYYFKVGKLPYEEELFGKNSNGKIGEKAKAS